MKTHKTIFLLVTLVVCFSQPINAHNTRGDPRVSYGHENCAIWHEARKTDKNTASQHALIKWVLGFLSGLNAHAAAKNIWGVQGSPTPEQISLWLDKYCRENPLNGLRRGAWELFKTLPDQRMTE